MATQTTVSMYTIGSWIDDFSKPDDQEAKLTSIKNLTTISEHLGPEKTRDELMVFLHQLIDEDEVVTGALAKELGSLFTHVGGSEHIENLLLLLESLAGTEESKVREQAMESILKIMDQTDDAHITLFEEVTFRLARSDWFACRSSALSLFSSVIQRTKNTQVKNNVIQLFKTLSEDSKPMVRRAVANKLGAWKTINGNEIKGVVEVIDASLIIPFMIPVFNKLVEDEQETVRFLAGASSFSLALLLTDEQKLQLNIPQKIKALCTDKAWRVRHKMAECIPKLQASLGQTLSKQFIDDCYFNLLKDSSSDVRCIASASIADFCHNLPEQGRTDIIINIIMPLVNDLVTDPSQITRASLAPNIIKLAPLIGPENSRKVLLPPAKQLLQDQYPEVRIVVIANMKCIIDVLGQEEFVNPLIAAVGELAEDKQWRVRLAVIKYSPMLAKLLGNNVEDQLSNFCMTWLVDCVYSVRVATSETMKDLTEVYGTQWAFKRLFPKICQMKEHPNYLYRMTTLFCCNSLMNLMTADEVADVIMPLLKEMVNDPIANVRLNVSQSCGKVIQHVGSNHACVDRLVQPLLDELLVDSDKDVRYYAGISTTFM